MRVVGEESQGREAGPGQGYQSGFLLLVLTHQEVPQPVPLPLHLPVPVTLGL